ncbi:6-O-methylguanine DNA methyltransferase [Russula compacta]|nr:6-O-methylguanine DNA methyltransferase [Russula compacta]
MPAERKHISDLASFRYTPVKLPRSAKGDISPSAPAVESLAMSDLLPLENNISNTIPEAKTDYSQCDIYYPSTPSERESFRTESGKRVPPHHWAVYDLIRAIPAGKVSTYKDVCAALGEGSPRSVGGALRNNPFAPRIPCHRVIASSFFVGGFKGEWAATREHGDDDAAAKKIGGKNWHEPFRRGGMMGPLQNEKLRMLVREGVGFGRDGKMLVSREAVWRFEEL